MTRLIPIALAGLLGLAGAQSPAAAHEFKIGGLTIDHPWARPTLPGRPSAAYAEIRNAGETPDRLVGAASPAFGAIELHATVRDGDVMRMERVEAIEVPAGGAVSLAPGGFHVMLFDPAEALADGAEFPLTLSFEAAGEVEVTVAVETPAAGEADAHGGHGGHGTSN